VVATVLAAVALAGCSDDDTKEPAATKTTTAAPTPPPSAAPPPEPPEDGACYGLTFRQALAPTNATKPSPCKDQYTSETYAVGTLDTVVEGHLLAVDSDRVQAQVACLRCLVVFSQQS
jgi:hypothetical protein